MSNPATVLYPPVNQVTNTIVTVAMQGTLCSGTRIVGERLPGLPFSRTPKPGLKVLSQLGLPVIYDGEKLDLGHRFDLLVEDQVVVEIKCVEAIHPVDHAQLLSYMRLSGQSVGVLNNLYVAHLRDGIKRMVDGKSWQQ